MQHSRTGDTTIFIVYDELTQKIGKNSPDRVRFEKSVLKSLEEALKKSEKSAVVGEESGAKEGEGEGEGVQCPYSYNVPDELAHLT